MGKLLGDVAVVTGSGSGLGRAIAVALSEQGARVVLVGRNQRTLDVTRAMIESSGGEAAVIPADVAHLAQVEALRDKAESVYSSPSILVNAAGIFGPMCPILDGVPGEWLETLSVNVCGPYLTCRAFGPGMVARGGGSIVNVSSAASLYPPGSLNSAYVTSKVALNQFTRHLSEELRGNGVRANVIHPGSLKTEMWGDMKSKAERTSEKEGARFREWVALVERTGGDSVDKATDLVLRLVDPSSEVTGQFCWIEGGLEQPMSSWEEHENH
jgi:NAD(P)-dependent dehydrogenase (short-subunit alcohol dehydrogenase family)